MQLKEETLGQELRSTVTLAIKGAYDRRGESDSRTAQPWRYRTRTR